MKRYKYVAVIGIDGMGNFNRQTDTPCMDRIFENGAQTFSALSMDPTISAENWGGMLLGALPVVHGLTNGYIACHAYHSDTLPSVFYRIREAFPEAYLASVINWEPINTGIVEDGIGVDKRTAQDDALVTKAVLDCVAKKPVFLFVQFDDVDGAGHHFGYGTDGHLQKITETDTLVGQIYDAYARQGIADDTLFLCIADHGGQNHSHGGWSDTEKYVYLAAAGADVPRGKIGFAVTKDIAAIVLYALGLPVPAYAQDGFSSQVPEGIFRGQTDAYRIPTEKPPTVQRESVPLDAPGGLLDLFGERLRAYLPFDQTFSDETGRCAVTENGHVKFYSNGVCSAAAEFGATGCLTAEEILPHGSFTLCFWLLADADLPQEICVLGNKSPEHGLHQQKGFNVLLRNHAVMVQYGCVDDDTDTVTAFDTDGFSGWIHVMLSLDADSGETVCWLDLAHRHTDRITPAYVQGVLDGAPFVVGDDARGLYNRTRSLTFRMDDLLVLDGTADDDVRQKLRRYYGI